VRDILSFGQASDGQVVIAPDITIYRELKLRLLNGTHTFCCGLAFLSGFSTVKEAMDNPDFESFMQSLMKEEILPSITNEQLSADKATAFANQVLDRFRNPYIEHKWLSITLQYSSKMGMRNVAVIVNYFQRFGHVPEQMARGFAAHILFMNCSKADDGKYYGKWNGKTYPVNDDNASWYAGTWQEKDPDKVVLMVLSNKEIWGTDLSALEGFAGKISEYLQELKNRYESISG
jgi:tagaturonate reductase